MKNSNKHRHKWALKGEWEKERQWNQSDINFLCTYMNIP